MTTNQPTPPLSAEDIIRDAIRRAKDPHVTEVETLIRVKDAIALLFSQQSATDKAHLAMLREHVRHAEGCMALGPYAEYRCDCGLYEALQATGDDVKAWEAAKRKEWYEANLSLRSCGCARLSQENDHLQTQLDAAKAENERLREALDNIRLLAVKHVDNLSTILKLAEEALAQPSTTEGV